MREYLRTDKPLTWLKVETYYNKGGENVFTELQERRGYYLSVSPVKRERGFESYTAFSGLKLLLLEVGRKSPKQEANAEILARGKIPALVRLVCEKNGINANEEESA